MRRGRSAYPILFNFSVTSAGVIALVALCTHIGFGQPARRPGTRVTTLSAVGGVDRGLRADGPGVQRRSRTPTLPGNRSVTAPRFVPGRVVVKFTDTVRSSTTRIETARQMGAVDMAYPEFGDFAVLTLAPGVDPKAVSDELNTHADVDYAQPDYLRQPMFVPDDPFFNLQWNLMQIGMERAWDINLGANDDVTVAVIDSGLAFENALIEFQAAEFTLDGLDYPALGNVTVPFTPAFDLVGRDRIVAPFDFVWMDEHPVDLDGHGTHVAGTVGQLTNNAEGVAGVAFNVRLMPLKVLAEEWDFIFGRTPVCCGATDSDIASAVRYAVEFGADVINMSLGGPDPSPVIDDAVRFAVERDVFVAIAGGNSFEEGNPVTWPAAAAVGIDGAMSVAAVDRNSGRAYYSNTGNWVEIAAPGGDQRMDGFDGVVQHTVDPEFAFTFLRPPSQFGPPRFDVLSYVFFQGTSIASPHVAGLAALLKAQGVTHPGAIEAGIKATAIDLGEPGDDDDFGAGLIDVAATLRGFGLAR